jgi:hypothetical protein
LFVSTGVPIVTQTANGNVVQNDRSVKTRILVGFKELSVVGVDSNQEVLCGCVGLAWLGNAERLGDPRVMKCYIEMMYEYGRSIWSCATVVGAFELVLNNL